MGIETNTQNHQLSMVDELVALISLRFATSWEFCVQALQESHNQKTCFEKPVYISIQIYPEILYQNKMRFYSQWKLHKPKPRSNDSGVRMQLSSNKVVPKIENV